MAMPATQIRRGTVLVFNGEPCRVIEFHHHTPGNLRAFVQTKMRNLRTGSQFEHRFRAADTVAAAMALATAAGGSTFGGSPTPLAPYGPTTLGCCTRIDSMRGTSRAVGIL